MPVVVTVHDVAWLHVQAHARRYARYYFGRFSLERYRHAAAIVVDSAFSRDALVRASRRRSSMRPCTSSIRGWHASFASLARTGGDGRTILAVGTVERRKNLELLIRLLPRLQRARIVSVGPQTPYARECAELARPVERFGARRTARLRDRQELLALYRDAAVVAVPSRYEGFGYAAAQALCAGVPCVVSDRTSLPEIVGTTPGSPRSTIYRLDEMLEAVRCAAIGTNVRARARSTAAHPLRVGSQRAQCADATRLLESP